MKPSRSSRRAITMPVVEAARDREPFVEDDARRRRADPGCPTPARARRAPGRDRARRRSHAGPRPPRSPVGTVSRASPALPLIAADRGERPSPRTRRGTSGRAGADRRCTRRPAARAIGHPSTARDRRRAAAPNTGSWAAAQRNAACRFGSSSSRLVPARCARPVRTCAAPPSSASRAEELGVGTLRLTRAHPISASRSRRTAAASRAAGIATAVASADRRGRRASGRSAS